MIVHAFMVDLDQLYYWYLRHIRNVENLCTKSMESCSLVVSQILAELPSGESDNSNKTLQNYNS